MQSADEVGMAARAGADFVGLVGAMPSGPGPIAEERIAAIVAGLPAAPIPVLLTARSEAGAIVRHLEATGMVDRLAAGHSAGVQLVRHLPASVRADLRARLPGLTVLQVLHVDGEASLDRVEELAGEADILLLDSGRPGAPVAELGGTGRTHDWGVSRRIVAASPVPVLLAGGLRPENVARAVASARPWGVDVCSGLRDGDGALVPERLDAFVRALREG